jgi:hypothetical protein
MQVDVEIDYRNNIITKVVGEPRFSLREAAKVTIDSDGLAHTRFNTANERHFGLKEWNLIYERKGDLSVVGIEPHTEILENWEKNVSAWRGPRIPVSLQW